MHPVKNGEITEPASNPQYRDQNRIANVVLPDEPQHAAIMRGETVASDPVNAPPRKAAIVPAPGWQAPAPAWGAGQPAHDRCHRAHEMFRRHVGPRLWA